MLITTYDATKRHNVTVAKKKKPDAAVFDAFDRLSLNENTKNQ